MVDPQTIISEAGASGISLAKIKDLSKLKDDDLDQQLKHLYTATGILEALP
jgi:hypothetical protein